MGPVSFHLDPELSREFPEVQIRFVAAYGLRTRPAQDLAARAFDLDLITGPVRITAGPRYACTAEVADTTRNIVFAIERLSAGMVPTAVLKKAQRELIELLSPHADRVIGAVIEPETPHTDLAPAEPAFVV